MGQIRCDIQVPSVRSLLHDAENLIAECEPAKDAAQEALTALEGGPAPCPERAAAVDQLRFEVIANDMTDVMVRCNNASPCQLSFAETVDTIRSRRAQLQLGIQRARQSIGRRLRLGLSPAVRRAMSKRNGTRCASWRASSWKPPALTSALLAAALCLTSCSQGATAPEKSAAANEVSGRAAGEVFRGFMAMSADVVTATETDGWTYGDGTAFDPAAADNSFNPKPCGPIPDGRSGRSLVMTLLGPPAADPAAARDRVQAYLAANGFAVGTVVDPPPGTAPKNTYVVTAQRADGAVVDYGANDGEQILTLDSECSAHPSLEKEVSAES